MPALRARISSPEEEHGNCRSREDPYVADGDRRTILSGPVSPSSPGASMLLPPRSEASARRLPPGRVSQPFATLQPKAAGGAKQAAVPSGRRVSFWMAKGLCVGPCCPTRRGVNDPTWASLACLRPACLCTRARAPDLRRLLRRPMPALRGRRREDAEPEQEARGLPDRPRRLPHQECHRSLEPLKCARRELKGCLECRCF